MVQTETQGNLERMAVWAKVLPQMRLRLAIPAIQHSLKVERVVVAEQVGKGSMGRMSVTTRMGGMVATAEQVAPQARGRPARLPWVAHQPRLRQPVASVVLEGLVVLPLVAGPLVWWEMLVMEEPPTRS